MSGTLQNTETTNFNFGKFRDQIPLLDILVLFRFTSEHAYKYLKTSNNHLTPSIN